MNTNGPKAKHWCFTLNNYTPEDVARLTSLGPQVEYLIFGKEVGASGTPHLQGYVCFPSRKRMSQCIQLVGRAHYSVTKFVSESITYCKKDGDFIEIGTPPKGQGKRNDLEEFKNSVKEGVLVRKELRELHSDVLARFPKFCYDYLEDQRPPVVVPPHPLRVWQQELNATLNRPADDREIIFVVDTTGNVGKSWFARYYSQNHDDCQIIIPGKKADMAYMLDPNHRCFFFDCPRSKQGDFIQYDFLEEVKNGYVFSPKYESRIKSFKTPHVVVLMNEHPDMLKLSNDRYKIINI